MRFEQLANSFAAAGLVLIGVTAEAHATLTVSPDATSNVKCSKKHVCTATAVDAILNVTDLTNMLAGSDVTLVPGTAAMDIGIAASVSWATTSRLTLDAYRSINVEEPVTVMGTGTMTFTTNAGGSGGLLTFGPQGYVNFWDLGSSLIIDKKTFVLVSDIASLASGIASNPKGNFALAKSYDASPDGAYAQAPVRTMYKGAFDGLGNTISNLTIDGGKHQRYLALFAKITKSGSVGNLRLTSVSVKGKADYTGALVAYASGRLYDDSASGKVSAIRSIAGGLIGFDNGPGAIGCHFDGAVSDTGVLPLGGLIGETDTGSPAPLLNDHTTGSVTYRDGGQVGGLVGRANGAVAITSSYSTSTIKAKGGSVGGLVGAASYISIADSYATGSVTLTGHNNNNIVGGLVGINDHTTIDRSFASGDVTVTGDTFSSDLGGLVGYGFFDSITDSHAGGAITIALNSSSFKGNSAGGLVGKGGSTISTSYATGAVSADGLGSFGGLVGEDAGDISQSYATGSVTSSGGGELGGLVGVDSPYHCTVLCLGCGLVRNGGLPCRRTRRKQR